MRGNRTNPNGVDLQFGPFRAAMVVGAFPVGFTHGYSRYAPSGQRGDPWDERLPRFAI
jgi:hypothetical protein